MTINEECFELLYSLIKQHETKRRKFGRPRSNDKELLRGILWVLKSGVRWRDLPRNEYPPNQTCHRRFQEWINDGVFQSALGRIAKDYKDFDLTECSIDGTFANAKKAATQSGKQREERSQKLCSSEMLQVFLSPHMWQALRLTRSRLRKKR